MGKYHVIRFALSIALVLLLVETVIRLAVFRELTFFGFGSKAFHGQLDSSITNPAYLLLMAFAFVAYLLVSVDEHCWIHLLVGAAVAFVMEYISRTMDAIYKRITAKSAG